MDTKDCWYIENMVFLHDTSGVAPGRVRNQLKLLSCHCGHRVSFTGICRFFAYAPPYPQAASGDSVHAAQINVSLCVLVKGSN